MNDSHLFTVRQRGARVNLIETEYIDVAKVAALALGVRYSPLEIYDRRLGLIATVDEGEIITRGPTWEDL